MIREEEFFDDVIRKIVKEELGKIKNFELATIDPNYTSGKPRLIFDGEDTVSTKSYPYLASYTPTANDRVILLGKTILGKIEV